MYCLQYREYLIPKHLKTVFSWCVILDFASVYAACSLAIAALCVPLGHGCSLEVGFVLGVWLLSFIYKVIVGRVITVIPSNFVHMQVVRLLGRMNTYNPVVIHRLLEKSRGTGLIARYMFALGITHVCLCLFPASAMVSCPDAHLFPLAGERLVF